MINFVSMNYVDHLICFQFQDKEKEVFFKEHGYVIIDLLDPTQIEALIRLYQNVQNTISKEGNKIFTTGEHLKESIARETNKAIEQIIDPALNMHIENYEALMAAFIVKPPHQEKDDSFAWHQDLSFVDEQSYTSAQVWISIENTNTKNGSIQIMDKTHRYTDVIRTAPFYPSYFHRYLDKMKKHAKYIPLSAGQALIFNYKPLHASVPNQSSKERLAIITSIKPKEAKWHYFLQDEKKQTVSKYEADLDFFLNLWINKKIIQERKLETFEYNFPEMQEDEFVHWKREHEIQLSLFQKLCSIFE